MTGITGRMPEWLRGTYYINGPARFERAGRRYKHWLDGDGMVCRLHFGDAGRPLSPAASSRLPSYRTKRPRASSCIGGSGPPGRATACARRSCWRVRPTSASIPTTECCWPLRSSPFRSSWIRSRLETRGVYDFNGSVNEVTPFVAHAKYDGHLMNFGISFSADCADAEHLRIRRSGQPAQAPPLPAAVPALESRLRVHSESHGVLPEPADHGLQPLLGRGRFGDGVAQMGAGEGQPDPGDAARAFERRSLLRGCRRRLLPARDQRLTRRGNASRSTFCCWTSRFTTSTSRFRTCSPRVARAVPVRYWIDLATRQLVETIRMDYYDRAPDFPNVDQPLAGHRYNDFWMLGISSRRRRRAQVLRPIGARLLEGRALSTTFTRCRRGIPGRRAAASSPIRPIRAEGVVICEHLRPAEDISEFVLFDAFRVKARANRRAAHEIHGSRRFPHQLYDAARQR